MSAVAEIQPMFLNEEGGNDLDIQFDPRQFEAVTPYTEDLNDEYQQAQDTQKEGQFKEGRTEITEDLTRYLSILDREAAEAQRLSEECAASHERLEAHLSSINTLNPETWSRADRKTELARALSCIEAAEDEIDNIMPLLNSLGGKKSSGGGLLSRGSAPSVRLPSAAPQGSFLYWLRSGFAFSLPLVGFAVIALLLVLLF